MRSPTQALLRDRYMSDDPAFLYWVSQGEIEMIAGSSALDLGDPAKNRHHERIERSCTSLPPQGMPKYWRYAR
jgi:hypothetical protein